MSLADDMQGHLDGKRRHVRATSFDFRPADDAPARWDPANRRFHAICPADLADALREEIKARYGVSSWTHLQAETIHEWADWLDAYDGDARREAARDAIDRQ